MSSVPRAWLRFAACGSAVVLMLGLATTATADPKPLSKEEQAKVDKAVDRAVAYLKSTQRDKGDWPTAIPGGHLGQTLLPAYALLEAGVPANDPGIQKAADYIRPEVANMPPELTRVKGDTSPEAFHFVTYQASLAVLFLDRLGDPKDKKLIHSLALRLVAGQHHTGGWGYGCPALKDEDEQSLLKLLGELSKRMEAGDKPTAKLLKELDVPRRFRSLAVFQNRHTLTWHELPKTGKNLQKELRLDIGPTDNSNTQFAMLALWVAQRYGVPVRPTFDLMVQRFERTQLPDGWWPYGGHRGPTHSMVCVGLLGLAIGRGLKIPSSERVPAGTDDMRILKGLAALYGYIGVPTGQMKEPILHQNVYFLWSLERVGMLYDLPTLGDKEWYRWGAEVLVTNQKPDGHWDSAPVNSKDPMSMHGGYGPTLNAAFALLFLKRSHPMKELTPKLPFKAGELNEGIIRLVPQGASRVPATSPGQSRKPQS